MVLQLKSGDPRHLGARFDGSGTNFAVFSANASRVHLSLFSPDGKKLVYCSRGERSGQWQLVTIDIENPTTKRYIGHGLFPQWSPKGNTILFQRARERGTRWFSVWTVPSRMTVSSRESEMWRAGSGRSTRMRKSSFASG